MTSKEINYIIKDNNFNFYDELYKSLDDNTSDDENNICQITGEQLTDFFVELECKHKFNYLPLYTDIFQQKINFKTYTYDSLTTNMQKKFKEANSNYFIRCPYCRDIQFTLLPFNEEIKKKYNVNEIYGINSLLTSSGYTPIIIPKTYGFYSKGFYFSSGENMCENCSNYTTCLIPETNKHYCTYHHKFAHKEVILAKKQKLAEEKKKLLEEKKKLFEEKKKLMEEKKIIKQQLLEQKNALRIAKGLKPLGNKQTTNETIGQSIITEYVPEELNSLLCKGIIKSGPNKGKQCTSKHLSDDEYCCKHSDKYKEIKKNNPSIIQPLNDFINANN